jgi:hypothetical protein
MGFWKKYSSQNPILFILCFDNTHTQHSCQLKIIIFLLICMAYSEIFINFADESNKNL